VVLTAIEAVERRLELSAIWFPASRAFGDLVPGELGGRRAVVLTAIEAVERRLELSAIWFPAS
jgi:hypothetical protein